MDINIKYNKMTVRELIEELKYMDEDATVRFASQPSWPLSTL